MTEILEVDELLEQLKQLRLSSLERMVITHDGTVQTLLAVLFNRALTVNVRKQYEDEEQGEIVREIDLRMPGDQPELIVMEAYTRILMNSNCPEVLELVRQQTLGLGQIAAGAGSEGGAFYTRRKLMMMSSTDQTFTRTYVLYGFRGDSKINFLIKETFYREMLRR